MSHQSSSIYSAGATPDYLLGARCRVPTPTSTRRSLSPSTLGDEERIAVVVAAAAGRPEQGRLAASAVAATWCFWTAGAGLKVTRPLVVGLPPPCQVARARTATAMPGRIRHARRLDLGAEAAHADRAATQI